MSAVVYAFLSTLGALFRFQLSLQAEIVALRHQLAVYKRSVRRLHVGPADRILWTWLSRHWASWREALVFVQPATVIAWQRKRFRDHCARMSRAGKSGRPPISKEIRELIRKVSGANPLWGTPRIVGELGKLGIKVAKSTVDKYRVRSRKPPSPTWKTFLRNHVHDLYVDRFVHRTDDSVQAPLRLGSTCTFATESPALQRYRESDCSVDGPADRRSLPMGQRAKVSPSRSRCDLR
jgi:putative transposase